jgi:hypothetical protein
MPSKLQYVCALEAILARGLHPAKRAMLLFHAQAPQRTVTMAMLAERAGYRTYSAANLQYGRLAADLARYGEFAFPDRRFAISSIGRWGHLPAHPSGHFSFAMHEELAEAIAEVFGRGARGRAGKRQAKRGAARGA